MKIGHEEVDGLLEVELQGIVKQSDAMLRKSHDYSIAIKQRATPEQQHELRHLTESIAAREQRVLLAQEQVKKALEGLDRQVAKEALEEAVRLLEQKIDPRQIIGPAAVDFDTLRAPTHEVAHLLEPRSFSTGREMLSAVETLSAAHGGSDWRAAKDQEVGGLTSRASASVVAARALQDPRLYQAATGTPRLFGKQHEQQSAEVPSWFDEAIDSVRESTDGKISCPLIKADFDDMWERVYWRESKHVDADDAARQHIKEIDEGPYHIAQYGPEMVKVMAQARLRLEAVLAPDQGSDSEQRKRAAVMIIATALNIDCMSLVFAVTARNRVREAKWRPAGGDSDVAHGFGLHPITTDGSNTYKRYADVDTKDDFGWTRAVWRMALETAAFPNVADTITAMGVASREAMKHMIAPPEGTASNTEVRLMQIGYWAAMLCDAADKESRKVIDNGHCLDAYTWLMRIGEVPGPRIIFDAVERVAQAIEGSPLYGKPELFEDRRVAHRGLLRQWCCVWRESGYARVDVSHKLAAALMLTDVGDELELRAPWEAFSVHIPPGITRVSRILVLSNEEHRPYPCSVIFEDGSFGEFSVNHLTDPEQELLQNFVRGVCLAVEQGHAPRAGNHGTSGSKNASKRFAKGVAAGERYQLAAPVKIDLRDVVLEHLDGKRRGGSPKVQFIVRGHWRNQAVGPARSLRKRIWVHPFWKGPEESRVLMRGYSVEGEPEDVQRS